MGHNVAMGVPAGLSKLAVLVILALVACTAPADRGAPSPPGSPSPGSSSPGPSSPGPSSRALSPPPSSAPSPAPAPAGASTIAPNPSTAALASLVPPPDTSTEALAPSVSPSNPSAAAPASPVLAPESSNPLIAVVSARIRPRAVPVQVYGEPPPSEEEAAALARAQEALPPSLDPDELRRLIPVAADGLLTPSHHRLLAGANLDEDANGEAARLLLAIHLERIGATDARCALVEQVRTWSRFGADPQWLHEAAACGILQGRLGEVSEFGLQCYLERIELPRPARDEVAMSCLRMRAEAATALWLEVGAVRDSASLKGVRTAWSEVYLTAEALHQAGVQAAARSAMNRLGRFAPRDWAGSAIGQACDLNLDCASGLCEGLGCAPGLGRCADRDRPCTADVTPYCGCDGVTFGGSSSCPGGRYSARGPCPEPPEPSGAADPR